MVHRILIESYLETYHEGLIHEARKHRLVKETSKANKRSFRFRNIIILRIGPSISAWTSHMSKRISRIPILIRSAFSRKKPCETC
jgi:hypothetical protein